MFYFIGINFELLENSLQIQAVQKQNLTSRCLQKGPSLMFDIDALGVFLRNHSQNGLALEIYGLIYLTTISFA